MGSLWDDNKPLTPEERERFEAARQGIRDWHAEQERQREEANQERLNQPPTRMEKWVAEPGGCLLSILVFPLSLLWR